jgi:O-antigen/teichoic acid export membrane protein
MNKKGWNLRKTAELLQMDRTVVYGIIANSWTLLNGLVTLLLIIRFFSSEMQGYYYTFSTIIALKVFIETGFSAVVVAFASHEWSKLHLNDNGYIVGDPVALSRLVSLARIVFRWYFIGGLISLIGLGIGGYLFFSADGSSHNLNWKLPWSFMCVFTVINMWLMPTLFLLEGCNQVKQIYSYRLVQGICVSATSWVAIILGANLWTTVIIAAVNTICLFIFILIKYKHFFVPMISFTITSAINWRSDLAPMQWRIALSWISGYFVSSFFTPLIFHYQGSVAAGQFGMTWMLFGAIGSLTTMWIAPKVPQFGMLVAKKDYDSLDKLFFKSAKMAIGLYGIGAIVLWFLIFFVFKIENPIAIKLAGRVMAPLPAGIFLVGLFFIYFTGPFSSYLRAHGKEPTFIGNVLFAFLTAILAWVLVKRFSILGVSVAYSAVAIFFAFPYVVIIWFRSREKWHHIEA